MCFSETRGCESGGLSRGVGGSETGRAAENWGRPDEGVGRALYRWFWELSVMAGVGELEGDDADLGTLERGGDEVRAEVTAEVAAGSSNQVEWSDWDET